MAKRVRAARHYQRKDSAVRLLAMHAKPALARDFRGALGHLGTLVPTERALGFARAGDWAALKAHISWGHYREILKAPFSRIGKLRQAAGELGAQKINGTFTQAGRNVRFGKAIGDRFNFDLYNQATLDRLREEQDRLIQDLETSARDAIDTIIADGARMGLGPEDIVDDVRDLIGLTDRQALASLNYERMLRDLDPQVLERQLRNVAYDEQIQAAIDSGQILAGVAIDRMVDDYIDRSLDYRASTIAQTESTNAANAGLHDSYKQAIERGALPAAAITRFWQLADHPCPVCESIPDLNPDGVGVGEDFDSIDGPIDDPTVHVGCMCSVEYITDLDKVPDSEE